MHEPERAIFLDWSVSRDNFLSKCLGKYGSGEENPLTRDNIFPCKGILVGLKNSGVHSEFSFLYYIFYGPCIKRQQQTARVVSQKNMKGILDI